MVPPEDGVERFRDKEEEETLLTIPHSGSCGITVTEAGIDTVLCEGIAVNNDNNPDPENVIRSDDVLPTPSPLTFGFHDVDPWGQSGNFPVGKARLKMNTNPRIQHMSCLDLFTKLYFID